MREDLKHKFHQALTPVVFELLDGRSNINPEHWDYFLTLCEVLEEKASGLRGFIELPQDIHKREPRKRKAKKGKQP